MVLSNLKDDKLSRLEIQYFLVCTDTHNYVKKYMSISTDTGIGNYLIKNISEIKYTAWSMQCVHFIAQGQFIAQ